jgi:hypothetical protein
VDSEGINEFHGSHQHFRVVLAALGSTADDYATDRLSGKWFSAATAKAALADSTRDVRTLAAYLTIRGFVHKHRCD